MYEQTLQSAVHHLATKRDGIVPMKRLWQLVCREGKGVDRSTCTLPDFAALLEADPRFDIVGNGYDPEEMVLESLSPEDRELFELGFCPTCSVRLRLSADGEDLEEMPSIVHRHLSETSGARPARSTSATKAGNSGARSRRGKPTASRSPHTGGKRRSR